ncbi:hypothetical protein SDC9_125981 [bioreactor metagenome]|uniref:Uncharacterized protein n=1 Tax=bioreactor metagenome TaxID=1076179 RepID=A0A645CPH5_9ZZZZ
MEVFGEDDIHHAVKESHVRSASLLYLDCSQIVKLDPARVTDDKLGTLADLLFYHHPDDRVCFSRVGTYHHDRICMFDGFKIVCHCSASEGLTETCNCCGVSEMGTVVYVISAHHLPCEPLHEVVVFVCAACRGEESGFALVCLETVGYLVESLIPGCLAEFTVFFDERCCKSVRMVYEFP